MDFYTSNSKLTRRIVDKSIIERFLRSVIRFYDRNESYESWNFHLTTMKLNKHERKQNYPHYKHKLTADGKKMLKEFFCRIFFSSHRWAWVAQLCERRIRRRLCKFSFSQQETEEFPLSFLDFPSFHFTCKAFFSYQWGQNLAWPESQRSVRICSATTACMRVRKSMKHFAKNQFRMRWRHFDSW